MLERKAGQLLGLLTMYEMTRVGAAWERSDVVA
jgi:hypothetical protein